MRNRTCSWTSSKSELSISMKMGTAPAWITTRVWWDVPEAMFVKTHAASNCGDTTPLLQWHDPSLLYSSGKAAHTHTHSTSMSLSQEHSSWNKQLTHVALRAPGCLESKERGAVGCLSSVWPYIYITKPYPDIQSSNNDKEQMWNCSTMTNLNY